MMQYLAKETLNLPHIATSTFKALIRSDTKKVKMSGILLIY